MPRELSGVLEGEIFYLALSILTPFFFFKKQTNKPPVFFPVPYLYIAYVIFSQANFLISVVLIRFVLYLKKIILSKLCVLFCLVLLNSVLFNLVCFDTTLSVAKYIISISSGFFRLQLDSQVRSGQVRVFNVHLQSKLLKRTPVTGTVH